MNDSEDFVLRHFEVASLCRSAESRVTCLSIAILPVIVKGMRKIRVAAVILITFISNINVMATSKSRSVIWTVISGISIINVGHLLFHVKRQQERFIWYVISTPTPIVDPRRVYSYPRIWSVRSYGFAELRANEGESVGNPVAFLMKFGNTELVFRCSE